MVRNNDLHVLYVESPSASVPVVHKEEDDARKKERGEQAEQGYAEFSIKIFSEKIGLQLDCPRTESIIDGGLVVLSVLNPELISHVEKGDVLVRVGSLCLDGQKVSTVSHLISTAPRPLGVSFRRQRERAISLSRLPLSSCSLVPSNHDSKERRQSSSSAKSAEDLISDAIQKLEKLATKPEEVIAEVDKHKIEKSEKPGSKLKRLLPPPEGSMQSGRTLSVESDGRSPGILSPLTAGSCGERYTVVFREDRSLGLGLSGEVYNGHHTAVVSAVQGQAKESGKIMIGDVILRINGVDVLGHDFKRVLHILRSRRGTTTIDFITPELLDSELAKVEGELFSAQAEDQPRMTLTAVDPMLKLKSGFLYKQGQRIKNWKCRYFVVRPACIEYFVDADLKERKGKISLMGSTCYVRAAPPCPLVVSRRPFLEANFLLELSVKDEEGERQAPNVEGRERLLRGEGKERILLMAAESREDQRAWLEALEYAIEASTILMASQGVKPKESDGWGKILSPRWTSAFFTGEKGEAMEGMRKDIGPSSFPHPTLTVAIEYHNPRQELQQSLILKQVPKERYTNFVAERRQRALEIQRQAQQALEEAQERARQLQEEAKRLIEEARTKAGEELERARMEIEAAKQEAEAARQAVQTLQQANLEVQTSSDIALDQYKVMIAKQDSLDMVRSRMMSDGVPELTVNAFIEGHRAMEDRLRALEQQWQKEKENLKKTIKSPHEASRGDIRESRSGDQMARLLERIRQLEAQLDSQGIELAEEVSYETALANVERIAKRMTEIGSSDVCHSDPVVQKQLRDEYFALEKEMEKYTIMLQNTEEYKRKQAAQEREWDDKHRAANQEALRCVRRMMPVDVSQMSEKMLVSANVPSTIARRYIRINVLKLLRMNPQVIDKWHPNRFRELADSGLILVERRALHAHLEELGTRWQDLAKKDENAEQKWNWFANLRKILKREVDKEQRVPPKRLVCEYNQDLGYPEGPVFYEPDIVKSDDPAKAEKKVNKGNPVFEAKKAEWKQELQKHYRNLVATTEAERLLLQVSDCMDKMEEEEKRWVIRDEGSDASPLLSTLMSLLADVRKVLELACSRSGINLKGKRNPADDGPDTRSLLEVQFTEEFSIWCGDSLKWFVDTCSVLSSSTGIRVSDQKQVQMSHQQVELLKKELEAKNKQALGLRFPGIGPSIIRPCKPREVRHQKIKEEAASSAKPLKEKEEKKKSDNAAKQPDKGAAAPPPLPRMPVNPLLAAIKMKAASRGGAAAAE